MTVDFKDPLDSDLVNDAYVSKIADDLKSGKFTLAKVAEGTTIFSVQKAINQLFTNQGTSEDDVNAVIYLNENYITNGDSQKTCVEKLDAAVKTNENGIIAINSSIGQPNGIAPLNSNKKIDNIYLPNGIETLRGTFDASLNLTSPDGLTLADSVAAAFDSAVPGVTGNVELLADETGLIGNTILLIGDGIDDLDTLILNWNVLNELNTVTLLSANGADIPNNLETITLIGGTQTGDEGWRYDVDVAGTVDFGSGPITFAINDAVILNYFGEWQKRDYTDAVTSWNARLGAILPLTGDYNADQIDETNTRYFHVKNNLTALVDPTATDDETLFYTNGSTWFVPVTGKQYTLQDQSTGLAIWIETGGAGGGIELARDFEIPLAAATTVVFQNKTYVFASGGNQFYRNGVLLVRELAFGDAWSIDPLIAPTQYKEVDAGPYSTDILINPNAPASGLTEFSMIAQKNVSGGIAEIGLQLMAKGSLVSSDGSNNGELDVGADGQILVADSLEDSGLKWQAIGGGGVEIGTVLSFGGTAAPTGYLLCDGSQIDRTVYADLYAVIADSNGNGDGVNSFHIPDLRGKFLRGVDSGAANDPDAGARTAANTGGNTGDAVGSSQADANKNHRHIGGLRTSSLGFFGYGAVSGSSGGRLQNGDVGAGFFGYTTYEGNGDSRPKNINMNYIIKY